MTQSLVTSALAELAATAQPGPAERDRARLLLADYLAVAGTGAGADSARVARDALLRRSAGPARSSAPAGPPRCGTRRWSTGSARTASSSTTPTSRPAPTRAPWSGPSLLAAAAGDGGTPGAPVTTEAVLDSAVAGYQVMASLGELLGPAELYRQGLHPTAVCGVFGAAAAAGRLAGLDTGALRSAFGIALSLSAGSMAYLSDGAWTKRFHSGSAAAGGILAAELAAGGFTGPADAFGDPYGLMHIYGGIRPPARVDAVLAHAAGLPAVHETSVKFHPCCRYMHGVMDLLAAYRSEGGRVEGITRIDCGVLSGGMGLVAEPADRKRAVANMVDAQFSMPFGAALTLSRGSSSLADFQRASSLAAELQPLMDRTWMHTSTELDAAYPARWGAEVTLGFADGEAVELHTPAFRGSPGWPAGQPEIEAKAAGLLGEPAAGRLFTAVGALGDGDRFDPAGLAAAVGAGSP